VKTSYGILFLDIDGTLVGRSGEIAARSLAALRRARDEGCALSLCTGRNRHSAAQVSDQIGGQGYGIVLNGAVIFEWETGEVLSRSYLACNVAAEAVEIARREGIGTVWMGTEESDDLIYTDRLGPLPPLYLERNAHRLRFVPDLSRQMPGPPASIAAYGDPEQTMRLVEIWRQTFGATVCSFAGATTPYGAWYAQLTAPDATKERAAEILAGRLGVPREKTIAIGDDRNDTGLLRWAGLGICMGNGHAEARAQADHVTGTLEEEGVAMALERFVLSPPSAPPGPVADDPALCPEGAGLDSRVIHRPALYLGIDGGGTKTVATILNEEGVALGSGSGGPCNIASCEPDLLETSVRAAVDGARGSAGLAAGAPFRRLCAGVAGYTAEDRREPFVQMLCRLLNAAPADVSLEPDFRIAYWGAAGGEDGIVAIAGTGSVVYGRTAGGREHREDGLGFLLGDRGSGFNLGLRALRHTITRLEQGRADRLTDAIVAQTGAGTPNRIIQWLYGAFQTARVASLAPAVGRIAEEGDEVAVGLVVETAHQLRHSVRVTRHQLFLAPDAPVYPLGGLWNIGALLLSEFAAPESRPGYRDERLLAPFVIAKPKHSPAFGAAALAKAGVKGWRSGGMEG
jgi:N-acetylglucosamine kinase